VFRESELSISKKEGSTSVEILISLSRWIRLQEISRLWLGGDFEKVMETADRNRDRGMAEQDHKVAPRFK
jgi:hypothetical protein